MSRRRAGRCEVYECGRWARRFQRMGRRWRAAVCFCLESWGVEGTTAPDASTRRSFAFRRHDLPPESLCATCPLTRGDRRSSESPLRGLCGRLLLVLPCRTNYKRNTIPVGTIVQPGAPIWLTHPHPHPQGVLTSTCTPEHPLAIV